MLRHTPASSLRKPFCLVFLVSGLFSLTSISRAQQAVTLVSPAPQAQEQERERTPEEVFAGIRRSSNVSVNQAALNTIRQNLRGKRDISQLITTPVVIEPFNGVTFTLSPPRGSSRTIMGTSDTTGGEYITLTGNVQEGSATEFGRRFQAGASDTYLIVISGDHISISIFSQLGNFHLRDTSQGFRAEEEDPLTPLNCGNTFSEFALFQVPLTPFEFAAPMPTGTPTPTPSPGPGTGEVTINVLFFMTPQAKSEFQGDLKTEIAAGVEIANKAYAEAGDTPDASIKLKLTVAGIEDAPASLKQSGSFGYDLDALTNNRDVAARRKAVKADVVSLIRGKGDMWGVAWGLGKLSPSYANRAFNVVYSVKVKNGFVFAHELGHNLGCAHNIENVDFRGLAAYSHGWHGPVGNTGPKHTGTIMSYLGNRVPFHSNPNKKLNGTPIGKADCCDNARTIKESMSVVAAFDQQLQ